MRVRIESRKIGPHSSHMQHRVVNADTEEVLEGVMSAQFYVCSSGERLVLELADFDIDIEAEAELQAYKCGE